MGTSGCGGYCCKSRKLLSPKNLAKVDLWAFWSCVAFQSHQEGPWSILYETIWSLTSPRLRRISGSKNSSPRKDSFNPPRNADIRPNHSVGLVHGVAPATARSPDLYLTFLQPGQRT